MISRSDEFCLINSSLLIDVDQRIYIHHLETLQTLAQADYTFCLLISNFAREVTSEAVFGPNFEFDLCHLGTQYS